MAYLVGTNVVNYGKGDEVDFYIRENGVTRVERRHIPTAYFSEQMTESDARTFRSALKGLMDSEQLEDIQPEIVRSGSRYVVTFRGPRGMLAKTAAGQFVSSHPGVLLTLEYPVFSEILPDGSYVPGRRIPIETLLQEPFGAYDKEVYRAFTDKPMGYLTSVVTSTGDVVITTLDTGVGRIPVELSHGREVPIVRVGSEYELAMAERDFIRSKNLLDLHGHNIGFDLAHSRRAARSKRNGSFGIGVDGSEPIIQGGIPGHTKMWTMKGTPFVIDSYPFHVNHSLGSADKKLETIVNDAETDIGFQFAKAIQGTDFDATYEEAVRNPDRALALATYCHTDGLVTYLRGKSTREIIYRVALDVMSGPTEAAFTGHPVKRYYSVWNWHDLNFVRSEPVKVDGKTGEQNGNIPVIEVDLAEENRKLLGFKAERGYHTDVRVLYAPVLLNAFRGYLATRFPNIAGYSGGEPIRASLALERTAIELYQDFANSSASEAFFRGKHGISKSDLMDMLVTQVDRYRMIFGGTPVLGTFGPSFVIVENDGRQYLDTLALGDGSALVLGNGRVIANVGGKLKGWGADIGPKSRKGHKTDFERKLSQELIGAILFDGDLDKAYEIAAQRMQDLEEGSVDRKDLVYYVEDAKKDWYARAYAARNRRLSRATREFRVMQHETLRYGVVDIDGDFVQEDEELFLLGIHPIATKDYRNKVRGGLPGSIVSAAFNADAVKSIFNPGRNLVLMR